MARLKVIAAGNTPQGQAHARGKLFEELMARVLRHHGYNIDRCPAVNYGGMEIDIEGRSSIAGISLYAECKCYETELDAPSIQRFYAKYMTKWFADRRCHGLFIALPGINSHAKAFYREHCEANTQITVRLLEEEAVLEAIYATGNTVRPESVAGSIHSEIGTPGDQLLLYSDKGLFWVQYVIRPGAGIPGDVALFDARGNGLSDNVTIDYLMQFVPELADFDRIAVGGEVAFRPMGIAQDVEEIVEVRGSSACFEYQFPASPQFFVGRQDVLSELDRFVSAVLRREVSSRGVLFEANSGWGKSSTVLASVARLRAMGHFAVAIDSRSASSSQFILRVIDYALKLWHGSET
ncbi:MAG TPA: restriction endonuclease [Thermomicrobiales bacterium]|nr:restriction endonuclease [Thermomicrobiales bacterium]